MTAVHAMPNEPSRRRRPRGRWARALAGAALGLACLAAPAAAQGVSFTFTGRGWGHGVGMSQYGAEGDATHGWSAARIIAWYYRGTTLAVDAAPPDVRVLLASDAASVSVGVKGSGALVDNHTAARSTLTAGDAYTVVPDGSGIKVTGHGVALTDTAATSVTLTPTGTGLVTFGGRAYRGTLTISSSAGRLTAINTVGLDAYVQGVVALEMPSSWDAAALQAQAIAARSYAVGSIDPSRAFDVYPDTRSQEYGGVAAETTATNAAVTATANEVVEYKGSPVQTPFFSSSGGHTEDNANVWGGTQLPYLVGVPDPYEVSPMDPWPDPPTVTAAQLGTDLGLGVPVSTVSVLARGVSPRVLTARVTLTDGAQVVLTGGTIEADLGLPSTWFSVTRTPAATSGVVVTRTEIADDVVTHYRYPDWHHAAALLSAEAAQRPAVVAALIARGRGAQVSVADVEAFVAAHYAAAGRAAAVRRILALSPARQIQVLAQDVFPKAS